MIERPFRARARAIDMLGRQQIAGIPTAISELFKNAHDAYAMHVRADFLHADAALVIRDDGMGMTPGEFLERWLTLGTDSKVGQVSVERKEHGRTSTRPVLGEKGIGRLAMAVIGPQVLVVTRGREADGSLSNFTGAFVSWRLFEFPKLNLDEVVVPVAEYETPSPPSLQDLQLLVDKAAEGTQDLGLGDAAPDIRAQIESFPISALARVRKLPGPALDDSNTGTMFVISPVDDSLKAELRSRPDGPAHLVKLLIGFTNPLDSPLDFDARFWERTRDGGAVERIGPDAFWNEADFDDADHLVEGSFDERGTFQGRVRIFREEIAHTLPRPGVQGPISCGPFSIRFGVMQGAQRESPLPPDRWSALIAKAEQIGGLYVYRNGIRVLPYGDNDYDYLDIEKNRSKGAAYYFFSYRRMFGYISLDVVKNANLSEKAGREGFRENSAYREFQALLKNFFVQLAADFFRAKGEHAALFFERRSALDRAERARREYNKRADRERREAASTLARSFERLQTGRPDEQINNLAVGFEAAATSMATDSEVFTELARVRSGISNLVNAFRIDLPTSIGLPEDLRRERDAYDLEFDQIAKLGDLAAERVDRAAAVAIDSLNGSANVAANDDVRTAAEVARSSTAETWTLLESEVGGLATRLRAVHEALMRSVTDVELAAGENLGAPGSALEVFSRRSEWIATLAELRRRNAELLTGLAAQIRTIGVIRDEENGLTSSSEIAAVADQELVTLREEIERDLELAQLGMAVEIVSHEFTATIRSIRAALQSLDRWARRNPALTDVNRELSTSFEHLDSYLTLFTPLQRRDPPSETELSGGEVFRFLMNLFRDRLRQANVQLQATDSFRSYLFTGKPSVFYPVFVNLVDNAIFWLAHRSKPGVVELDARGGTMTVEDNGSGIDKKDQSAVFEAGFTRKPGGRGLGLYITKEVLARNGFGIDIATSKTHGGAAFRIAPISDD